MKPIVFLDTATTGLGDDDEVLAVTVVDERGKVLFHEKTAPVRKKSWPDAQRIHGMAPGDFDGELPLSHYARELDGLLGGDYAVGGYNVDFHLRMLRQSGYRPRCRETVDVLAMCDEHFGYWPKLKEAASELGYDYSPHKGTGDAEVCAYVYRRLAGGGTKVPVSVGRVASKKRKADSKAKRTATGVAAIAAAVLCLAMALFALLAVGDAPMAALLAVACVVCAWRGLQELRKG